MAFLRLFPLLLFLPWIAGCATFSYYAQSIGGQLDVLGRRQPIERLLADPETSSELRQRLQRVLEIRAFASVALALPDNGSYRSYADLERPAMVWSLVATPEFSMRPQQWCYPVIGCASYRGYFSPDRAARYAAQLQQQGLDVVVEPVPAYSTLGWFDDPLPNTVIRWPEPRLAGLIFHELAHQRLYVQGDSDFNEAFATLVAQTGVERWLTAAGDSEAMVRWRAQQAREQAFLGLLLDTRERLVRLYARTLEEAQMRALKQVQFQRLRADYANLKQSWQGYSGYDGWFDRELNNAHLASIATYEQQVPALRALLEHEGGDLAAFYRVCERLAQLSADERAAQLAALAETESKERGGGLVE